MDKVYACDTIVSRRKARESALMTLFQMDLVNMDFDTALDFVLLETALDSAAADYTRLLVQGVWQQCAAIDALIQRESPDWEVLRMAVVDRNILRLALFEMFYLPEIPQPVAINEAIELSKRYGGPDSSKFVNGILGGLVTSSSEG